MSKMIFRVAARCFHQDRILLHRSERDTYWTLPGGKCELGEASIHALKREFKEELQADIDVGRLTAVVENFFIYEEVKYQEIGLYFDCNFTKGSYHFHQKEEFTGNEEFDKKEKISLYFKWFTKEQLDTIDFRPRFLGPELFQTEVQTRHLINRDY